MYVYAYVCASSVDALGLDIVIIPYRYNVI